MGRKNATASTSRQERTESTSRFGQATGPEGSRKDFTPPTETAPATWLLDQVPAITKEARLSTFNAHRVLSIGWLEMPSASAFVTCPANLGITLPRGVRFGAVHRSPKTDPMALAIFKRVPF